DALARRVGRTRPHRCALDRAGRDVEGAGAGARGVPGPGRHDPRADDGRRVLRRGRRLTDGAPMRPILTPDETRDLDLRSAERGVPVLGLMERAGEAVARAALRLLDGAYGRRVVVLCGKGNNGGDGLVAARLLHRWGVGVTAILLTGPTAL